MDTETKVFLKKLATQLEQWANESEKGGWSTHQVEPQRKKSKEIYEFIGRNESWR